MESKDAEKVKEWIRSKTEGMDVSQKSDQLVAYIESTRRIIPQINEWIMDKGQNQLQCELDYEKIRLTVLEEELKKL